MLKKKKIVYVPLAADILHVGHLNILNTANKYGQVVVGLLTDKAIAEYKNIPLLSFNERYKIIQNLKVVKNIVVQDSWDYSKILNKLKPDFFVHGDDWKKGMQEKTRKTVIKILKKNGGKLIEVPYTKNISSHVIKNRIKENFSNTSRVSLLKRMIEVKEIVRIIEAHSPLCGVIIENAIYKNNNITSEYDGMWSSSLTDSTLLGRPDNQSVDYSTRIKGINQIAAVTTKPIIFDIDNGGQIEHLKFFIQDLERIGASAIVMEDKIGLKQNSLFQNQSGVRQDSIGAFCRKIKVAKAATFNKDFLIIPRIESFIVGKSTEDALKRAIAYSKAGSDCIMIHSKEGSPKQIFDFAKKFLKTKYALPLVCVPSTYSKTREKDLIKNGFKIVIYANQLMRASYKAMTSVAKKILIHTRAHEVEKEIIPVKEILHLIKQ
jgi:phosphoenolpyruvate phosphomutase / 2-hydroxyethylphosphonate cytidylyltransferase